MIQLKAMYNPRLLGNLIGGLRVVGGLGQPRVAIITTFTDQWIPGHFGHIVLGSHSRQAQDLIQRRPSSKQCTTFDSESIYLDVCAWSVAWDSSQWR
jgi:hypothetical protein